MNHQLQGKDQAPVESDLSSAFLYNHFSSHRRMSHHVGLLQPDSLSIMREQRRKDNFLAVAVQQQLIASLTSPSISLFTPLGSQSHSIGASSHPGGLLSRARQDQHNTSALLQRLSAHSSSSHSYSTIGMNPKLRDSLVCNITSGTERTTTAQQIPCLARGMATDHNSMVRCFVQESSLSLFFSDTCPC